MRDLCLVRNLGDPGLGQLKKQTNKQINKTSTSQQRQQEQNSAGAETVEKVAEAYRSDDCFFFII